MIRVLRRAAILTAAWGALIGGLLRGGSVSAVEDSLPASREEAMRAHDRWLVAARPVVNYTGHTRGNIELAVGNNGTFGTYGSAVLDPYTGEMLQSCVYPKNSDLVFLWVGAFWIGGVIGRDTVVSTGTEDFYENQEFWPDPPPVEGFTFRSIDPNSDYYSPSAYSEQDIYAEYTDTFTDPGLVASDQVDTRPHRPLGIKVNQRSMSWSYSYADDFILFDYQIENIGRSRLKNIYMGVWVDGDVWHTTRNGPAGWNDDIVGFLHTYPAPEGCGYIDTVNIAYHADNDGDPDGTAWDYRSPRGVVGTRVVRTPAESLDYSFNWWIINYSDPSGDFGPRRRGTPGDPYRDFGSRLGTPVGDRNKYYILRHPEFDYDLYETAVDHSLDGWLPPPRNAAIYARGYDTRYLLSFGPFNIEPGQRLPISFAWVGGENFHQGPADFATMFDPFTPSTFTNTLNFSGLAINSRWASWVYDNPGVDTDGDGYRGKFRLNCIGSPALARTDSAGAAVDSLFKPAAGDTLWYEGDGIPDFKGAGPPPAPKMRIIPSDSRLVVRWNGFHSETTPDVFTQLVDFEGYRVYVGLDDRRSSFTMRRSYDTEDFRRYVYRRADSTGFRWVSDETPYTLEALRAIFGDSSLNPLDYPLSRPLTWHDSIFYFTAQDFNMADLSDTAHGIHKVYPDLSRPSVNPADWLPEEITYDYDTPLPKYYEYEIVLDNLQWSVPLCVAVTCFDFGSPKADLAALETDPTNNMIREYPETSADSVEAYRLQAYVYPNPYRVDGDYVENGYENREGSKAAERARLLHFANLPNVCTISIYTIDGDLVRTFEHNYPEGGPGAMHDSWDLITRNTQAVVSGIYYFVVESKLRTQIGKFVVIK